MTTKHCLQFIQITFHVSNGKFFQILSLNFVLSGDVPDLVSLVRICFPLVLRVRPTFEFLHVF